MVVVVVVGGGGGGGGVEQLLIHLSPRVLKYAKQELWFAYAEIGLILVTDLPQ